MITTELEDPTRPRAVTVAATIVVGQNLLWIGSLAFGVLQILSVQVAILDESWEPWIVPAAHFLWHTLKPNVLEALTIIAVAIAVLKRRRWAPRVLEAAVLIQGLRTVPDAASYLEWGEFSGILPAFVWLPALLLALPLPFVLVLLERPASAAWFRAVRPGRES